MKSKKKGLLKQAADQVKNSILRTDSILGTLLRQPVDKKQENAPLSEREILLELGQLLAHNNRLLGVIASLIVLDAADKESQD
jgi:hypothetical protein